MSNSKTQLELLKKEINWWEESLNTQPKDTSIYISLLSPLYSTLCNNYNPEEMDIVECCINCPVYNYTGRQYCEETDYVDMVHCHDELLKKQNELLFEVENKIEEHILIKELIIKEYELYVLSCDYLEFLKEVLTYTLKQDKGEI